MSWRITEALESVVFHDSPPVKISGPKRRDSTCSVSSSPMALGDWSFYHATSSWVAPRGVGCHEEGVVVCIWHPYHMIPRLYEQILWKVICGTEWSKTWFVLPFFEVEAPIAGTKVLWPTRTLPSSRLQFAKDGVAKQKFDCRHHVHHFQFIMDYVYTLTCSHIHIYIESCGHTYIYAFIWLLYI